jgi:hypothetical protein
VLLNLHLLTLPGRGFFVKARPMMAEENYVDIGYAPWRNPILAF